MRTSEVQRPDWERKQRELADRVVLDDEACGFRLPWEEEDESKAVLQYVGGLDISFVKETQKAVASIVSMEYPSLTVVESEMIECEMNEPYIAGFLAFREVGPLSKALAIARTKWPHHFPQVFFVDGNGILHQRRCGLAAHLGVVEDVCTIGVAKNILNIDGLSKDLLSLSQTVNDLPAQALIGSTGFLYGYAALTGTSTAKPIFISPGHRISPISATRLALLMAKFRIVEPVRQADLRSREYIRTHYPPSSPLAVDENKQQERQEEASQHSIPTDYDIESMDDEEEEGRRREAVLP